jgi:hypothetical protein
MAEEESVEPEQSAEEALEDSFNSLAGYQPDPKPVEEGAEETEDAEEQGVQEAAEADTEEESDQDLVEVTFNGELIEAPRYIADALLRQEDYTKKTQEVANQRREVEAVQAQAEITRRDFEFAAQIQPEILKAEQIQAQIDQTQTYLRENLESLSATDIERIRLAIDDARQQKDEIAQSLQNRQTEFQQAREQSLQELLNQGTEVLRQAIPDWGDTHQEQVRQFALDSGFTEQEISTVVDPRQALVLYKAAQYDALQAGKPAAVKKVQGAPIKPKSRNPMPKEVGDKLNLRKKLKSNNVSASDKAKLIGEDIASRMFGG